MTYGNTMTARAFNFHGIGQPGPGIPEDERPYWISTTAFETFLDIFTSYRDRRPIVITFDDGNLSDIEIAAPLLAKYRLDARFFVLTGRLEQPGYLSRGNVRDLRDMGFKIGSHGIDHVDWAQQDTLGLHYELLRSRMVLEELLGQPVTEAAIPFGRYRRRVLKGLHTYGYRAAWCSDGSATALEGFLRPRLSIRDDTLPEMIMRELDSGDRAWRRWKQKLSMTRKSLL
ncbi:MAG: polysaccharide deacetylase family protein [Roseovarius sp.]|jgi:peptidoglycan/xylan/chitin deacetylase (PgdA/CDA1 family)|uniref:polysaccharide deacetylase family protein n=1 Tax=Roseovarius sp. TaxID=1486281 RepID=UPI0032F05C10